MEETPQPSSRGLVERRGVAEPHDDARVRRIVFHIEIGWWRVSC